MEVHLKKGIDRLLFGMKEKDVVGMYGAPDKKYQDEEGNNIYLYNDKKLRLTFYAEENFRLGYIICSHPQVILFTGKLIGNTVSTVLNTLKQNGIALHEEDTIDTVITYFNEDNWVTLQEEFNEITKVEIGAAINSRDEFEWRY